MLVGVHMGTTGSHHTGTESQSMLGTGDRGTNPGGKSCVFGLLPMFHKVMEENSESEARWSMD